jgi:AraC-like DNA-binding protein
MILLESGLSKIERWRGGTVAFDRSAINQAAFSYYPRLERVKEFVSQQYSEPISLSAAARVAGIEEKYFSTFFHAKVGVRFRDWLSHVRITRAQELMSARNHSITRVAHAVGFGDLRTFQRTFKKCTGMTPLEFKHRARPC